MSDASTVQRHELLLQGQAGQPGIVEIQAKHESDLYGNGKELGLMQKVGVMWKVHIWLACTVSGLVGYLLHGAVSHIVSFFTK